MKANHELMKRRGCKGNCKNCPLSRIHRKQTNQRKDVRPTLDAEKSETFPAVRPVYISNKTQFQTREV